MRPQPAPFPALIGYHEAERCFVNLAGDYDYLGAGYYASQDLEVAGKPVRPTCQEALDAYVTPVFLHKAQQLGLSTPEHYTTHGEFEPPAIVDSLNPFMSRQCVVRSPAAQERVARSLTRNFKYLICCQTLPPGARVAWFRAVLGGCQPPAYRALAQQVWAIFHLPLAKVRVVVPADGAPLLSGVWPLPLGELNAREVARVRGVVSWPT